MHLTREKKKLLWKKSTRIPGKIGMKTKFRTRVSFCDISYNEHGSIEKMKEQE
jgi:hypothetical protein